MSNGARPAIRGLALETLLEYANEIREGASLPQKLVELANWMHQQDGDAQTRADLAKLRGGASQLLWAVSHEDPHEYLDEAVALGRIGPSEVQVAKGLVNVYFGLRPPQPVELEEESPGGADRPVLHEPPHRERRRGPKRGSFYKIEKIQLKELLEAVDKLRRPKRGRPLAWKYIAPQFPAYNERTIKDWYYKWRRGEIDLDRLTA